MSPPLEESPMEVEEPMSIGEINLDDIPKMVARPMRKGESWYLVDAKWYDQLLKFIGDGEHSSNPGPIDNIKLFDRANNDSWELRDQLEEEVDYKFLPEEAWKLLIDYFGIKDERHTIKRWVIEEGGNVTFCVVEIYLTELKLRLWEKTSKVIENQYSRVTRLYDLEEDMKRIFDVDPTRATRIHHLDTVLDTSDDKTLADVSLFNGQTVVLELQNRNGTWPSAQQRYTNTRSSTATKIRSAGLCGLTNLGNTCFMNSALQCLSNTPPLTEFIISDQYLNEINKNNPLGMEGQIAEAYGDMIKNMWSGNMNCFTPRDFKYVVGSFAPQFSGYAQQDCQELMAFLLDGLHEDFNRITNKPYIEVKTGVDQRPDHIVAQESWENYKKRNDSIIVDTFHGLLKSTLVCPDCQLVSVTFDPFCYLSLPLPVKREKQIDLMFVPAAVKSSDSNGNKNSDRKVFNVVGLTIPKYGSISDISKALASANDKENFVDRRIDPSRLLVTEVHNSRLYKMYGNDETIGSHMKDLVIYEMPNERSIPVYLREVQPDGTKELFGRPFFIGVDVQQQYDSIHRAVADHFNHYVRTIILEDQSDSDEGVSEECENGTEMFSLTLTNSMGMFDRKKIDASEPIHLDSHSYLALDLTTRNKAKYYDPERERPLKFTLHKLPTQCKSGIPLSECINNFTTTEKLGADDSWYCPACKMHQEATKKFDLWQLPNVLIIHLKRFSYSRYWRDKLDTLVDFPLTELDMGVHVINNPDKKPMLYDLIAVICLC